MNSAEKLDHLIAVITQEMDERAAAIEGRLNARLTAQEGLIASLVGAVEALQQARGGASKDAAAQADVIVASTRDFLRRNLTPMAARISALEGQR